MSSATTAWDRAWADAQTHFQSIPHELINTRTSRPHVLRVGQLDAELLDIELVQLLRQPFSTALGLIKSVFRSAFDDELSVLLQLGLYKLSVWDNGATYGAKLQGLRYRTRSLSGGGLTGSGLPTRLLSIHLALTIILPYLHGKLRAYALSRSWPDTPSNDKRRQAWDTLNSMESLHSLCSLMNFILFLLNGRYRTLADRMLRLQLVSTQPLVQRQVSYEFMNRQLVWHAFSEFLLFVLPIVNTRTIRRSMRNMTLTAKSYAKSLPFIPTPSNSGTDVPPNGKYFNLPANECAICADAAAFDVTRLTSSGPATTLHSTTAGSSTDKYMATSSEDENPPTYPLNTTYLTSCNHAYCYICLSDAMLRARDDGGPPWECLRCGQSVVWSERAEADISTGTENTDSMDEYEFSTDHDSESLGESLGSIQTLDYVTSNSSQ